jgi:UDP-N-acetylmuramoyl-tripeptide--D-alanyl-D-alanine ligase
MALMARTLDNVAAAVGGELVGRNRSFSGVSTDTRTLTAGALFIALKGPHFDGHRFLEEAAAKGAAGAMVEEVASLALNQVSVVDTRRALGRLAGAWRNSLDASRVATVAITGSNGKTTTKELVAAILAGLGPVHATRGNFNNDIGLPLTLLDLTGEHRSLVLEMGANHPGEIAYLTEIAKPTVAVVTNAGPAHLEGFGSVAGVAKAKGELFAGLGPAGCAIINADDEFAPLWRELAKGRQVIEFGRSAGAQCRVVDEVPANAAGQRFRLQIEGVGQADISLPLQGAHNALNAAAAAAAAIAAGANLQHIVAGLNRGISVAGRLSPRQGRADTLVIDDSYNANPASVLAAIETLAGYPGRRILVLGDMAELGAEGVALHRQVGAHAARLKLDGLVCVGQLSAHACDAFGGNGVYFEQQAEALTHFESLLGPDLVVLVKGSRSMALEQLVNALVNAAGPV